MRKKIIAGNWKMNNTPAQAYDLAVKLKDGVNTDRATVVFCAPFVSLFAITETLKGTHILAGAQNVHFEESGAYTGEISASMLSSIGVSYVIAGHSERRAYFGDTDDIVNKKVKKLLEHKLVPIMCVGETLAEREKGITIDLVRMQTRIGLNGLTADEVSGMVIAYEPVWAIGTGKTATSSQAEEVCAQIRKLVAEVYGEDAAQAVRILYGGSVTGANAEELFSMPNIDGGLVGGASLKPEFAQIVEAAIK